MKKIILNILYKIYAILGKAYIKKYKPIVIGVTGSVGKTSCRMIIYQVLKQFLTDKKVYTSPKNFNSELGLVFSIFALEKYKPSIKNYIKIWFIFLRELLFGKKKYDIIVLEYGVDHPGDMDFLLNIVKPDYSVFTKLDFIHVENFENKEQIGHEKIKLVLNTKVKSYLNKQDEFLNDYSKKLKTSFDFFNKKHEYKHKYICEDKKIFSMLKIENNIIKTNILGDDNFVYLALAINILKNFQVNYIEAGSYINLVNQNGRFNLFNGINGSVLIDSTYNAGPASMLKMIENTVYLRDSIFKKYDILFVIGDMRELGKKSNQEHRKLYHYLKSYGKIVSIGKETSHNFGKHLGNFKYAKDAGLFVRDYLINSDKKYIVLFKGSQNTIFTEEALKEVLADKRNAKRLVRQDDYWMENKKGY
ncbi:MAG: Mur ligase family protein [Candidatus Gracilibacteria bacterium]|nr:Mur ligase family protein [Candidatus Gracilibacteria bacterium]